MTLVSAARHGESGIASTATAAHREPEGAAALTTLIAGVIGAALMYWTWRQDFGVGLQLTVPLHIDSTSESVRPWAPWWVPAGIMGLLTMALWWLLAVRRHGLSRLGGILALMLASYLTYSVGSICLEYGAVAQYVPMPPLTQWLSILPLVLLEGLQTLLLYLIMGFPFGLIGAAILGAAASVTSIGLSRFMARVL